MRTQLAIFFDSAASFSSKVMDIVWAKIASPRSIAVRAPYFLFGVAAPLLTDALSITSSCIKVERWVSSTIAARLISDILSAFPPAAAANTSVGLISFPLGEIDSFAAARTSFSKVMACCNRYFSSEAKSGRMDSITSKKGFMLLLDFFNGVKVSQN